MIQEIELSNGAVYEVDAPDDATQEQLMGAVADGLDPVDKSVLRSKNDDFGAFLRGRSLEPAEGESEDDRRKRLVGDIPLPEVGAGRGMLRAGMQGATFGAGDEIVGAGAAALDTLTGRTPNSSFGELYDAFVARERDKIGSFRSSNPALAIGAEIAGAIPPAVLTGGGSLTGTLGQRVLTGAGIGSAQGSAFGFNAGEGGFGNRLGNAALTGALGGSIGAAAPAVAAGAKNVFNATVGARRAATRAGMSRPTFEALSDIVEADRRVPALADDALLAERGPSATSLADFLTQRPGPSQRIVQDAVAGRVAGATRKVAGALDDTLGTPQGIRGTARGIAQQTSGARRAAYEAAYEAPINYADKAGRRIEGVLGRIPKRVMGRAVQEANEAMQAEGITNRQIIASIADDGTVTFGEKMNVQQLDFIKRALGEIGEAEVDTFGRPTGAGLRVNKLARALRDAVADAVPEYSEAIKLGGDKIARDNGLRLGSRLLSPRTAREEVKEFVAGFRDLPDDVLDAIRTGIRANIDDTMANVKRTMSDPNVDAREAAKAIKDLSGRAAREKLTLVLGEDAATGLLNEIDQAATAFNLQAATVQNSKTAVRAMLDKRLNPSPGAVGGLLQGRPLDAAQKLAQGLTGRSDAAIRQAADAQAAELARALTQSGQRGRLTLGRLQQGPGIAQEAERIRMLAEQLVRRNAAVTAPGQENLR